MDLLYPSTKERNLICSRNWKLSHKEQKRAYDKEYRLNHKERCKETLKQWKINNPGRVIELDKKWKQSHREQLDEKSKERYKLNPEKYMANIKKWQKENPDRVKQLWRIHRNKRFREMGCNYLNDWFDGCEGHHINKDDVICIPKHIHKSIWHDHNKPNTMIKINLIAWDCLEIQSY